MKTTTIGFPRIGAQRELKFATEGYFKGEKTADQLLAVAKDLRQKHWRLQEQAGIDYVTVNDFSLYDNLLDTIVLVNAIPKQYTDLKLSPLDTYFAMARGYQGKAGDVKALAMKKWFNTNYHYLVPEIDDDVQLQFNGTKLLGEIAEAKALGLTPKATVIGPFTFLKLAKFTGKLRHQDVIPSLIRVYQDVLKAVSEAGVTWLAIEEPALVTDVSAHEVTAFGKIYQSILSQKHDVKVLCQTYFGDVRDCYDELLQLPFDGIGLDFVEGKETKALFQRVPFPKDKVLFAGVVNGKNIWRNHYAKTLALVKELQQQAQQIVLNTSCSLLHVPFTTANETQLDAEYIRHFAFAVEKLGELRELADIVIAPEPETVEAYQRNAFLFAGGHVQPDAAVQERVQALKDSDFVRLPVFAEREAVQKKEFNLPPLPTTTIGSFPQTAGVRKNRAAYKKHEISEDEYIAFNKREIADCIQLQETIGLDVLVHGEFERNDMVEYFGEHLKGFLFTQKAWVQSYGTRCVKPPIIWGDVSRLHAITVPWSTYAQSLTKRPVKGMLTGPVTILNWSFPREDISLKDSVIQIALAIRDEVLDLEANGIHIIQIDEAALREKLPLRKADWHVSYLDWAIPAFRLVHSGVKASTQIHTHMCYSEFNDIIQDIDDMDADVITFEASRSDFTVLDALKASHFKTEVGPGVYDIHSPRIPSEAEIAKEIQTILTKVSPDKLWINPDCGLKTRGLAETKPSLQHMVDAAKEARKNL